MQIYKSLYIWNFFLQNES